MLKIGDSAPEFVLKDQNEKEHSLSELIGKKVLLSFHPLAWTGICTDQMKMVDSHYDEFTALNTTAFGVSIDTTFSKKAWAESMEIKKLSLLSDFWPHGKLAGDLGIFREKNGFSERANIIIDETGKIIFFKVYPIKLLPDLNEVLEFLKQR
ncbi:MAG TPA: redoxin domain-containing protein [Petrotogaceae bacterium]|nr:redoxin domain-containing protein [Petrotogaceae bacterium]